MFCICPSNISFHQGPPVAPALCKLLQQERLWNDMTTMIRAIYPGILLLRMADALRPSMDKLYFSVRLMDSTIQRSKKLLNEMESNYMNTPGNSLNAQIMNYFFSSNNDGAAYTREANAYKDDDEEDEDDDGIVEEDEVSVNPGEAPAAAVARATGAEDEDSSSLEPNLGEKFEELWNKRKPKLVHDLSISGWMVSPVAEVMNDAKKHHEGYHRNAVDRLLRKWYIHTVSQLWLYVLLLFCFYLLFCFFLRYYYR